MSLKKLSSPPHLTATAATTTTTTATACDLKQRVITCLNKLSDRDTLSLATSELESIARALSTPDSFSTFLNCLQATDTSSKSPVRRQCVSLLSLLSNFHGNSLSPHLPKMLATVTRRLRDPDSAVRSACVAAASAMSSNITRPPFSSLSRPLLDVLTAEQDSNSQLGAAMCLAAAIEAAPEPEAEMLRKVLPRLVKLVKSEGFKAKAAVLGVIGSIVSVGGACSKGALDLLVPCLVDFLSSEDWAARKAAAEALGKVAVMEKELTTEWKVKCLSALERRRFDKVKVVRETMNRTLELWKEVPGVSEEVSASSLSTTSSTDSAIVGCFSSATKSSIDIGFKTPTPRKNVPVNRSPPSDASSVTTAIKQSPTKSNDSDPKRSGFNKVGHRKHAWKIEIAAPQEMTSGEDTKRHDSEVVESVDNGKSGNLRPETRRALFGSICSDKHHKFGRLRSGSRVVPYQDDESCYDKDVEVSNPADEFYENPKDLSLICDQLVQIQNQQSNILDLLQRFIGSSQSGINSLVTRVNGLEMALDEISNDLALSSGRTPNTTDNTCCKLPGTEYLSSKFWRTEGGCSSPRFSSSGSIQLPHAMRNIPNQDVQTCNLDSQRFQHQNRAEPGENPSAARGHAGFCSSQMSNSIIQDDVHVHQ